MLEPCLSVAVAIAGELDVGSVLSGEITRLRLESKSGELHGVGGLICGGGCGGSRARRMGGGAIATHLGRRGHVRWG